MKKTRTTAWTPKQKRILARVAGVSLDVADQVLAALPPVDDEWVLVDREEIGSGKASSVRR